MIICFFQSEINEKAIAALQKQFPEETVQQYPHIDFSSLQPNDRETIYLLDLQADGELQNLFSSKKLADFLITKGLSTQTHTIYFLVSDVLASHRLLGYAGELTGILAENYNCFVRVQVLSDLNEAAVFITPPENSEDKWHVFTIKHKTECEGNKDITDYQKNTHKCLYWEGEHITDWLADPERTIES